MVELPTLRDMLKAGVHFGHKTSRWNPNMAPYIFVAKSGVHVINLEKTAEKLEEAVNFLKALVSEGKIVVFVGTKKQASEIVKSAAEKAGMPYINWRWLGGTLTNFDIIKSSVAKFKEEREILVSGNTNLTKRELTKLRERVEKGEKIFGGLINLTKMPDALILIGAHDEKNALHEAKMIGLPVIALTDTNTNPNVIDYPIPANDDAIKSIELFTNLFADIVAANKRAATQEEKK